MIRLIKIFVYVFFINTLNLNLLNANTVNEIQIIGNDRISKDTIILFSNIKVNENIREEDLNVILKNLYDTNFFKNVSVSFKNNILLINVEENSIIEKINYTGIKSQRILEAIKKNELIRSRSSYEEIILKKEKERLYAVLRNLGYLDSSIDFTTKDVGKNLVNININIDLGNKAKIKKISFVGNKVFKDRKLRRIIASSEYRF